LTVCRLGVVSKNSTLIWVHYDGNAIEEELEVLYDAYYEELEQQYAN
jgi:hypothetical protein